MSEFPQIPPIPPGWKMPPYFSSAPVFDIYEKLRDHEGRVSTEIAAIKLADTAVLFLIGFQPPPGSDYVAAYESTPNKIQVFTWMNRTKPFLDYLDAYLTEIRREGTPEQIKFLRDILDRPTDENEIQSCSIDDEDEADDVDKVDRFPEPSEAITILDRIAQGYATTSIEYVALQIAIRALRHLIESGEAPEFMRYVDQMSTSEPPSVE